MIHKTNVAKIPSQEMLVIMEAAWAMAHSDGTIQSAEQQFLEMLARLAGIDLSLVEDNANERDMLRNVEQICDEISGDEAKKLLILTLASVAMIDNHVDEEEKALLERYCKQLKVGRLNLKGFNQMKLAKQVMFFFKRYAGQHAQEHS